MRGKGEGMRRGSKSKPCCSPLPGPEALPPRNSFWVSEMQLGGFTVWKEHGKQQTKNEHGKHMSCDCVSDILDHAVPLSVIEHGSNNVLTDLITHIIYAFFTNSIKYPLVMKAKRSSVLFIL